MASLDGKILWLVTARSGSRSVPHKNVRPLGGHPLLAWKVAAAARIAARDDVWVSTDSEDYARIAEAAGARVPFLRPAELATDTARSVDVVLHAMEHAEREGRRYAALGLLEPTSPFVLPDTLAAAGGRLLSHAAARAIVAVREVRPSTFYVQPEREFLDGVAANILGHGVLRRQDEAAEITPSGGFYIARWEALRQDRGFYTARTLAHPVGPLEGLEIDEPIDWDWAEFLVATGRVSPADFGLR